MAQYSYLGKGSLYIDGVAVGNVTSLELSIDEEKKENKDYENAGGGNLDVVSRISAVSGTMRTTNISPENLAIAMRGTATARTGATVTDEAHNDITCGKLLKLDRIPDPAQSMTVKKGVTTLVENTDYTRVRAGIIPIDSTNLSDLDDITVSYTALADNLIQALVSSAAEYNLVFDGLNEAKSGASVIVDAFKCKFSPAQAMPLIGDEFAELEMTFDVVKDTTKTGAGVSQYFTFEVAQVA